MCLSTPKDGFRHDKSIQTGFKAQNKEETEFSDGFRHDKSIQTGFKAKNNEETEFSDEVGLPVSGGSRGVPGVPWNPLKISETTHVACT